MGRCKIIVTIDAGSWHLSISTRDGTLPSYKEIKKARYRFTPGDIYMAEIFPPMDQFVNLGEIRHLWQIENPDHD